MRDGVEGSKARGRGGKFGRWRTLKNGRRVFVTGGTPEGGLFIAHGGGRTLFDTFGNVDPERVDRLIHDFESMPSWATRDIGVVEVYERLGERFKAGGESFQTGMDYNHAMGRIRVFQANEELSEAFTNEGFYHEVGHNLDRRWTDVGNREISTAQRNHPDWFRDDGAVKSQHQAAYKKTYPMGSSYDHFTRAWLFDKEDGITPYSKAWAKEGNWGETFAEFSRIYFGGYGRGGAKVSRRNVSMIGKEKGAPNLAGAFADAMDAFAKGQDR